MGDDTLDIDIRYKKCCMSGQRAAHMEIVWFEAIEMWGLESMIRVLI
jgi:hypothetical protein